MDQRRRVVRTLFFAAIAIGLSGCGPKNTQDEGPLHFPEAVKWVTDDADLVSVLTSEPAECLVTAINTPKKRQLDLGRLAFRSPYLLGGQATRQGLSCHSCHTNGDVNRNFFIQGLSRDPGTADVTSFHFSKTLGDREFNPKPIPSLVNFSTSDTMPEISSREAFILRLIEEEFNGTPPTESVKSALITYVEALDFKACSLTGWNNTDLLDHQVKIIDSALALLMGVESQTQPDADFIRAALRNELGRLNSYYPEIEPVQTGLKGMSLLLKNTDQREFQIISSKWSGIKPKLTQNFERSFYHPDYVRKVLAEN